ncbi:MAG: hypothetical protein AAF704_14595 [Cyanobacteria bacterium P01_D01_bin.123]
MTTLQFASEAQEATYYKVKEYLEASTLFQDAMRVVPEEVRIDIIHETRVVRVEVLPWQVNPWDKGSELAIVRASSRLTIDGNIDTRLMHHLLRENARMRFGAFQLDDNNEVVFSDTVLGGSNMDLFEMQTCILAVATVAVTYDSIIDESRVQ